MCVVAVVEKHFKYVQRACKSVSRDPPTRVCHVTCCRRVRHDAPLGHATGVVLSVDLLHRRRGDVRRQHRRVAHRAAVRAARQLTHRPRRTVAVHLRHPQVVRSRVNLPRVYFRSFIVVVIVSGSFLCFVRAPR